jgi:hypothetical protein
MNLIISNEVYTQKEEPTKCILLSLSFDDDVNIETIMLITR